MSPDLVDLLGAMADYFDARREYNAAAQESDGSFGWYGRSYIEDLERAYDRVVSEWNKVAAQEREAVSPTSERTV